MAALTALPSSAGAEENATAGFVLRSDDGESRLRIGLEAAYQFQPVVRNGESQSRASISMVRPVLEGSIHREWIRFLTSFELASNPPYLLDSYVHLAPWKEATLRVGQQKTGISRHESHGPQQLLFPEVSTVADYFWTGRDKGATFLGTLGDDSLDYFFGLYGGSPLRQFATIPGDYAVTGRLTANPQGKMAETEYPYMEQTSIPTKVSFTLQGYASRSESATENFDPTTFRFEVARTGIRTKQIAGGADVYLQSRTFALFGEAYVRRSSTDAGPQSTSVGVWAQAGVLLVEDLVDAGVRFNWLDPSHSITNDNFYSAEGELSLHVQRSSVIVRARYGYGRQNGDAATAAAVSLPATPGNTHVVTLQLNLTL